MITTYRAAPGIDVLTTAFPVPGFGQIPVNAYVLHGEETILVDTGPAVESDDFMAALRSLVDPADIRWIWLTHTDFDHIGSLHRILEENTTATVVTTFLGVGIMSLSAPLPMDRINLVNPGSEVTLGGRTLAAFRPPTFDNPVTTGFFDTSTRTLFSADCFGALLDDVPERADDLSDEALRQGQIFWATVDSPWLHRIDRALLAEDVDRLRALEPETILSSHLPAAPGSMFERLAAALLAAPDATPFVGPDQAALEAMLAEMQGAAPA